MRKPVLTIAALAASLWTTWSPFEVRASQGEGPPITKDRLTGTWEGLSADNSVFMVVVAESGTTAAIGTGLHPVRHSILRFSITKTTVKHGRVHWEGVSQDPDRKYRVDIRGYGKEFRGARDISAQWRLLGPKGEVEVNWLFQLVGRDGTYIERMANLAIAVRQQLLPLRPPE